MTSLAHSIDAMHRAKQAYEDASRAAWMVLLDSRPEVRTLLEEFGLDETAVGHWFCAMHFDEGQKTAIEMFEEGRGREVVSRIGQIAHGVYR